MPELINWDGLKSDLDNRKREWTPIDQGTAIDFDGIRREIGYKEEVNKRRNPYKFNTGVTFDEEGKPWYEITFQDIPKFIADKALYTSPISGLFAFAKDFIKEGAKYPQVRQAITKYLQEQDRPADDPYVGREGWETAEDILFGIEGGYAQFVELLTGQKPETLADAIDLIEYQGMKEQHEAGQITDDDYKQFVKGWTEAQENPLTRDIVAGVVNSALIMGSLAAGGGLAGFTTRGLKFGSKAWLSAYGRGMWKSGVATWKIMGAGATVKSLSDSIDEMKIMEQNGENPDVWDFLADVGINMTTNHASAFLEGMSEGMLLNMRMGSVPLKKWMARVGLKEITKDGTKVFETAGVRQLRRLIKGATNPKDKYRYQKLLAKAVANRKEIAQEMSKNFGKSLINAFGFEVGTEQVTDAFSDLTEGTHSSFVNLFSSEPEHRKEALKTLYVEAAVSTVLGYGMGMSEIFSRNPIAEIEKKYGAEVAGEIERELTGQNKEELARKIKKAKKNPHNFNEDSKKEQNVVEAVIEQGKGGNKKDPEDTSNAMDGTKLKVGDTFAKTINTVESLSNPNLIDYIVEQGRTELAQYFQTLAIKDKDFRYNIDSFLMDADSQTVNAITGAMYRDIVKVVSERGLLDRVNWTKQNESHIKKDLAVAIALNFDETGWAFLKHKYQTHENIDFYVEEARNLQASNVTLKPNDNVSKKYGQQTVQSVMKTAKDAYRKSVADNIGLSIAQVGSIIDAEVALKEQEELFDEATGVVHGSIASVEVVKDEEGNVDLSDMGSFIEDEDILAQDALTIEELDKKAVSIAALTNLEYKGYQVFPAGGQNNPVFTFESPISKRKIQATAEELSYSNLIKQSISARGGTPMHAVAYKDYRTGIVHTHGPGHTHSTLLNEMIDLNEVDEDWIDGLDDRRIVASGFVDKSGKFYTTEQVSAQTGFSGESATQGVNRNLDNVLFETRIPSSSMDMPKYSALLEGYEGTTVRDLVEFLAERGYINEKTKEVVAILVEHVGDVELLITPMDPKNPGVTLFDGKNILMNINPEATLWGNESVWDTLCHEMVHAFTRDFMKSGSVAAKTFNGKIKGVMNTVYEVLNSDPDSEIFQTRFLGSYEELQQFKKKHGSLIVKSLSSEFEFIASVISDTQSIKWLTDKVNVGGPRTKATGWRRIVRAFQSALEKVGIRRTATAEVFNILERQHKDIEAFLGKRDLRFNPKLAKENRRVSKQVTSGFDTFEYNDNEDPDDLLDPMQKEDNIEDEDANELENASIENFTRFMALAWGVPEPAFREHVKGLADFEAFVKEVNEIDEANKSVIHNKIRHLYQGYYKNFKNVDQFKRAFLKRQYLNIVTKEAYDTFVYMGIRENDEYTGDTSFRYELRQVKGSYRDGRGKKRNTYRQKSAIEDYIPELELKLGLDPGTLKLGFVDGFETWQGGKVTRRSSLDRIDAYMFNGDAKNENVPVTGFLADALWEGSGVGATKKGMLYIGNLAGKNTLPVLFFDANKKDQVKRALESFGEDYYAEAIQEFQQDFNEGNKTNPLTKGREMSSITRALLEDIWFKAEFVQQEDGTWTLPQGNSQVNTKDWNKTMKRAAKWAAMNTGIILTEEEVEQEFGNAPINGIRFVPGDAIVNTAIVSSKGEDMLTFEAGGRTITRSLKQLMQNELGTSRIDGASFYIIGHFDRVYRLAHGALKSGALKNLYASRHGDDPLFIKHAMHGIKADSPLGKFMIQHNIAMLVADESMKEGPQDKIIGAAELMDNTAFKDKDPILQLKLSQFTRIKEEQNTDTRGGSVKQMIGGSGYSELFNEIIAEAMKDTPGDYKVSQILKNFSDRMSQDALEWFQQNTTQEAIYELLQDIVYNPKSPQEHTVSELWIDYIEPQEGQTIKDVLSKYGGAMQHAHTAEVLRNRMQYKLSEMLGGKTTGMRGALDPNLGWLNYDKDVAPVEAQWNLADILATVEDLPAGVAQAAFPEQGLYEIAQRLLDLQRRDTRAHNQLRGDEKRIELDNNEMSRQELIGQILELNSERLKNVVKEGTKSVSINSLVNWKDPKVKEWTDSVVWGKERFDETTKEYIRSKNGILDIETGALREGWAIITEDIADGLGVKPGDWVLLVVTPTDSAMGVIGVRIAGIAKSSESKKGGRKVSDNNKITVNSEWAQSLVGKDFDIDTISLVSFDERFWNKNEFEHLCKVANKVPRKYLSKMVQETKALFSEKSVVPKDADGNRIDINDETVLRDEVRELYSVLLNGTPGKRQRRRFPIVGASFIELDSAYLHDPAPIINERLFHTAISTINMRSKKVNVPFITNDKRLVYHFKVNGKEQKIEMDFTPRNVQWLRTHINHLHMTNAEVDFPNNTTRLAYISDPKSKAYRISMGSDFWGLRDQQQFLQMLGLDIQTMQKLQKLNNLDAIFRSIKGFQKFLFDDSFNLARQRNSDTFEKLDYITTVQQLRRAQRKLAAVAAKDINTLKTFVNEYIDGEKRKIRRRLYEDTRLYKDAMLVVQQQKDFLYNFIENMEIDDVYAYPLFETIKNIDVDSFPVPGNTYKDHLINQVMASQETLPYYPVIQEAYNDAIEHARTSDSDLYKVRPDISYKPAWRILKILGQPTSDAVNVVRDLRKNREHFEKLIKRLKPWELDDLKDAIREFDELDRRAGKAFEPFERDGQMVYVDMEAIAMERMMRSLDYAQTTAYRGDKGSVQTEVRGKLDRSNPRLYWSRQLRGFRYEVNSILHAFDEKPIKSGEKGLSETAQQIRHGHASTYPTIWKALLESPFLFLNPTKQIQLKYKKDTILMGHKGDGTLYFGFRGEIYSHTDIQNEISDNARELKKLLTERDGLWEGIADNTHGTHNRIQVAKLITMARNLTMERRIEILEEYIADNLYASTRGFTRDDQLAFWIGIMAQVSDQGMLENKGTGFIVNQSPYNKLRPFKFQTNHVALTLMSRFETELTNVWLQNYSLVETARNPHEKDMIAWAIRHGMDSDIEMLYQDAQEPDPNRTMRHFFSDYVNEHKTLTKDLDFVKFYKKMRTASWKDGLTEVRNLAEGVVMLKALSENGIFYEDLVYDLKTLSDADFYNKYKGVDTEAINVALERYMGEGVVDEFIRQRAGESDVEFRTRGNIISTFYLLNGVKKREGARNKKLNFMRRIGANVIGYDMVAILGEKQTRALSPKNEIIGYVWSVEGINPITVKDAQLAMRTHATRTDMPLGESVIAITKGQNINRALNTHQITLNNQSKRFEDVAKLLAGHSYRNSWRVQFVHKKADKRIPHTARTKWISTLLDQIPESADMQLEVRREQIFSLAEDLKKNFKIEVGQLTDGTIIYSIKLGKEYKVYNNLEDLVEKHLPKLKASQKLALIGAVDIRIMYDIMVPSYLRQAITYLERTRDDLNVGANVDQALQVDAMINKYQLMLAAISAQKGNYMPHQFPIARYKDMWMKGYIDTAIKRIEKDIQYHKLNKTGHPLGLLDPKKDGAKIKEMALRYANKVWDQVSAGWNRGSIIPNFIPRRMPDATGYTKTDPTTHFNYITKLIEGLKKDALRADWYLYQANARQAGERQAIIELTRNWYADQIGDRSFRTVVKKWSDIKPGQQVTFSRDAYILTPGDDIGFMGSAQVSGVVRKITNDEITLNTDTEAILFEAKRDLDRWENASTSMVIHGGDARPSQRQWNILQNFINKGIMTQEDFAGVNLKQLDEIGAATLIIKGIKRVIANPQIVNTFKRSDVWASDVAGNAVSNSINIYTGTGVVERLNAKADYWKNLQLMGGVYDNSLPKWNYLAWKGAARLSSGIIGSFKKLTGLFYMGMAAAGKARVVNQLGAVINNVIDAPIYNFQRWQEGSELWSRIKHGQLEMMDEADAHLYKTLVGLGLTENNNILAIALEAANIKPEDMLINDATPDAIKWLARLFRDATKYDSTYKALAAKEREYALETDHTKRLAIKGEINQIKLKWEARMHNLLKKGEAEAPLTEQREKELWKQLDEAAKKGKKINIAEEQGFTAAMAAKLFGKVAWKSFYTSNFGMGFQAKAERMRIPAFFIGYTTAIHMGFTPEEAIQLGVNSVELRHAFYGSANKQYGANTKLGTVAFQYAQYQYNAISKATRIMREMVPQMLRFAHNRPETVSRLKHMGNMLKLIQTSSDAKGKALKRGQVTLKEVNLLHGVMMKVLWTSIMMQVGTRIFYGITNFQDPIGQVAYRAIDFIIDLFTQGGLDFDDEDDRDNAAWMLQDLTLPLGLLYKMSIQATVTAPVKGFDKTFVRGRVDDTFDFVWRTSNTIDMAAYQLGVTNKRPRKQQKLLFDAPWIVDDFVTGIKLWGWTSADNRPRNYTKYGFWGKTRERSFSQGRYVETRGKGISGTGQGGSNVRALYLFDPLTYIPFLDRLVTGK